MRIARLVVGGLVLVGGAVGLVAYRRSDANAAPSFRFATVEKGNLESTVSATGTLNADTTVQVGTQVSGRIIAIDVDFNDHVKQGQLLARIDPTPAQQTIADAEAGVRRAQATLDQTTGDYQREKAMFDQKVVTLTEFATARSAYQVAQASLSSAQVALDKAKQELSYTNIYSPITGIIVERNVNVGQTVAASFSAPQLFLIANDLSNMQILASVDETDIGLIKNGQPVRFTVQAYPKREFTGTVKQVRLQSATQDNVVNYTVVVAVKNPDGALLPGMTATVNFLTGVADSVLTVPNAALRFQPTPEMLATLGDSGLRRYGAESTGRSGAGPGGRAGGEGGDRPFAAGGGRAGRGGGGRGGAFRRTVPPDRGVLWYLDNGRLRIAPVRTGLTNGQLTQIESPRVTPGMKVIVGLALGDEPQTEAATSPFQQQQRRFGPGPGGRF